MADTHFITKNKLGQKAERIDEIIRQQKRAFRAQAVLLALSVVLWAIHSLELALIFYIVGIYASIPLWGDESCHSRTAKLEAFARLPFDDLDKSQSARYRSGQEGEDKVLELMRALPDDYTLFNQVEIPNAKSSTGFNEADFVVVGPEVVFAIEVKNHRGHIVGSDSKKEWTVDKKSRNSGSYQTTMRNPVTQVRRATWLLSQHFKNYRVGPYIQPIVVFSNDNANILGVHSSSTPVIAADKLVEYIVGYKSKSGFNQSDMHEVIRILSDLRLMHPDIPTISTSQILAA